MKKFLLSIAALLLIFYTVKAEKPEKPKFSYNVNVDLTSAYLWRGFYDGGLSLQPSVNLNYGNFTVGAWGNLGSSDWKFNDDTYFFPELDIYLIYYIKQFKVSVTHLHYFDSKYFDFSNGVSLKHEGNTNQTEVMLSYTVSDNIPLSLSWATQLWGGDGYYADSTATTLKRAYSSYLEVAYNFRLPYEINLTTVAGFSPWRGLYTEYEGNFAFNNLSFYAEREFSIEERASIAVFAQEMTNFYNISGDKLKEKLKWAVGISFRL